MIGKGENDIIIRPAVRVMEKMMPSKEPIGRKLCPPWMLRLMHFAVHEIPKLIVNDRSEHKNDRNDRRHERDHERNRNEPGEHARRIIDREYDADLAADRIIFAVERMIVRAVMQHCMLMKNTIIFGRSGRRKEAHKKIRVHDVSMHAPFEERAEHIHERETDGDLRGPPRKVRRKWSERKSHVSERKSSDQYIRNTADTKRGAGKKNAPAWGVYLCSRIYAIIHDEAPRICVSSDP